MKAAHGYLGTLYQPAVPGTGCLGGRAWVHAVVFRRQQCWLDAQGLDWAQRRVLLRGKERRWDRSGKLPRPKQSVLQLQLG